jgi:Outer membrane protein beta-barrel domain
MVTASRVLVLLGALTCAASAARAQYPQRREGFWLGLGLGYGSANITCDNCGSGSRMGGTTVFLKLGGTPSRNVRIGASINAWTHEVGGTTEAIGNVTASLFYYPVTRSGFFVTGGLGFAGYNLNSSPEVNGSGWGFTTGAGYDIRVGRNLSLTPVVNYVYGALEDFGVPGIGTAHGWKQNYVDVGLGVTFH